VSYVLAVIKYYKHGLANDVFNHIQRVYDTITFGSQVRTRWMMEDGDDYDEDDVHVMGVCKRVFDEIVHVRRREHIDPNNLPEIHLLEDDQKCLWKQRCGDRCTPVFCSLRCRIRTKLYEFLSRFHTIMHIMDDIEMLLTTLLHLMQTKGTSYRAQMLHYLMFHPMNQPKDIPCMCRSLARLLARLKIVGIGETKRRRKKNKKRKIKNKEQRKIEKRNYLFLRNVMCNLY
jgi:hypothetical protein